MGELAGEESVEVRAPADALWRLRADFRRLSDYNPKVRDIEVTSPGSPDGSGATYRFTLDTSRGPHPVVLQVTESEPGRLVAASMRGAMAAEERFEVAEDGPGHAKATLTLWIELPRGLPTDTRSRLLAEGRDEIRRELDAMARIVESEVPGGGGRPEEPSVG